MYLCSGFCLFAIMVHIAPHATDLGISTATAANILAAIGAASIVGKVVLGSAADRIGGRQVFIICFTLMSASLLWLVPSSEVWMLYLFAVVFGLAYGGMGAVGSPLAAGLFGVRSLGLIFGVLSTGLMGGCALGPIVAGYLFDITGSYQMAFMISAAISIIGLILAVVLRLVSLKKSELAS